MKFVAIVIILFNITGLASAQTPALVAGVGPTMSLSAGYSYVSVGLPSSDRVGLIGPEAALTVDIRPNLGLTIDLGYARRSDVLGTTRDADMLSYMAGPVIYPVRLRRFRVDGHALVGGARITGVAPVSGSSPTIGYVNDVSWAVGSNVEFRAPGGNQAPRWS